MLLFIFVFFVEKKNIVAKKLRIQFKKTIASSN